MGNSKIGTFGAISLILTTIITHTVLSLTKNLLNTTKSSIIINLIYLGIIALLIVLLINKLFKKFPGMDILDICNFLGGTKYGKLIKNILGTIFIAYFIFSSAVCIRNFCESLKIIYYQQVNIIYIIYSFIFAILLINRLSFNATLKANLLVVPFALITTLFLFLGNIQNFNIERIFPIFGNGIFDTFVTGIGNIYSFSGIIFLYFLPPLLKEPKNFKKIGIISIIISLIYLLLCVAITLFMFSAYSSTDSIIPLYIAARYIEFGAFFQRLEVIFLLVWVISFACYLGITTRFCMLIYKKITNIKNTTIIGYLFPLLILATSLIPRNYAISKFFEDIIYKYWDISLVFIISISILIFSNLKRKRNVGVLNE